MNGDKENFHDEIAEMAAEREFEDSQAEQMYQEMERAKPYLGEGVIFGSKPILGFGRTEPRKYSKICARCDSPIETYQERGTVWCDDCIPF